MSKRLNKNTVPVCVPCFFVSWLFVSDVAAQEFESQVAPLLSQHCVECHNGSDARGSLDLSNQKSAFLGGESGPAIVPRHLDESLLWQKVSSGEMPPDSDKSLSIAELNNLKTWIQKGASWTRKSSLDQYEFSGEHRAGRDWWSLQPVRRPQLPPLASGQPNHPIDRFIERKKRALGLPSSSQADRQKLYRRLCFDLTGLPPDPDEAERFINAPSVNAYETIVDRMLASPRYGERWGRHWLDIAHYADTHGYERDQRRPHAWRYRDFVIQSFNDDRPYDEFVKYQLAGDVLNPDSPDANIATGFLACGPYDFTGLEETSNEKLRRQASADDLDDMITTVLTSTMGLTINCARCHDHKFDPIPQKDYYEFASLFANVTKQDRVTMSLSRFESLEQQKRKANKQIARIDQQIKQLDKTFDLADIVAGGNGAGNAPGGLGLDPRTGLFAKGKIGMLNDVEPNRFVRGLSRFVDGCFIPDGGKPDGGAKAQIATTITSTGIQIQLPDTSGACWDYFQKGPCLSQDFTELDNVDYQLGEHTLLSIHANKGITFDLDEIRKSTGFETLRFSSVMGYGGKHQGSSADVCVFVDGNLVFERQHVGRQSGGIPIDLKMKPGQRFLTLIVTDDQNGIGHDQIFFGDAWIRDGSAPSATLKNKLAALNKQRQSLRQRLRNLEEPGDLVYAVVGRKQLQATHVQIRGNPESIGESVSPAGLGCITQLNEALGTAESSDQERRKNVAAWITSKQNPLFARVIVNRLWHYHFGQGLVRTPSDFGFLGDRPSHPKLLDWLAVELMDSEWSIKHIQRLIVTSATYRQASASWPEAMQKDAGNRLLWRMSPRRLESEAIRDAILATTGTLNLAAGGPGYQDFEYVDKYAPVYKYITADRPELWKRSVYRFTVRSVPERLMKVLDCPNPSSLTPSRNETTTALQSLSMLNHPFMISQAKYFAERLEREESRLESQIDLAFRLAFSRMPTTAESRTARQLAHEHGLFYFCRALLNANEFIYID